MHRFSLAPSVRPAALLVAMLGAGATSAQEPLAGSESQVAFSRSIAAGGGSTVSATYAATSTVAAPLLGARASSASFTAFGGTAFASTVLASDAPIVFGTVPSGGAAAGGESTRLLGFHFAAPGAGTTTVTLGGQPAGGVTVLSQTQVEFTTPAGLDANGNPLGPVDVELSNTLGSAARSEGYVYEPGLRELAAAHIGGVVRLELRSAPSMTGVLLYGFPIAGLQLPVPPLAGALVLIDGLKFVGGAQFSPSGVVPYTLPVPDKPALVGVTLPFQAISLTNFSPVAGSFTNVVDVTFQP